MTTCSSDRSGRNRTGRPAVSASSGMSTMRPRRDTPSSSFTTATAYGASGSRPRGGMRITVNETTLPVPCRGTSSQRRSRQPGHSSFGGMASSPQLPQRIAESRPALASSKKPFSVITRSVTTEQAHQDRRGIAAERVRETDRRAVDLSRPRLAAELGDDLANLRRAGRADRMALGLEATGGIDRDLAAEARPPFLRREAAGPRLEEAEAFRRYDLRDGEAIVELDDVDVAGRLARLAIRALRRSLGRRHARQVALFVHEHGVGGGLRAEDPNGAAPAPRHVLGSEDDRGPAVGERTAVEELEGVGHVRALEHRL